jgi:hypothetical protein
MIATISFIDTCSLAYARKDIAGGVPTVMFCCAAARRCVTAGTFCLEIERSAGAVTIFAAQQAVP